MTAWERVTGVGYIGGDLEMADERSGYVYRGKITSITPNGVPGQLAVNLQWLAIMSLPNGLLWSRLERVEPNFELMLAGEATDVGDNRITFRAVLISGDIASVITTPVRVVFFPKDGFSLELE